MRTLFVWTLCLVALIATCCGGTDANANCPGAYFPAQNPNPDPKNDAIPCGTDATPSPSASPTP